MKNRLISLLLKSLDKTRFILGLSLSLIGTLLGLFLPQFIGKLLDIEYLERLISNIPMLISLVGFFFAVYTIQAISSYLIGDCGSQSLNRIQKYIYSNLLRTTVGELDQYQSGDIASRLTNDMSVVLNFITVVLPNLFLNILVILGSIYFLLKISPSMTLMSLIILPLLMFIVIPINNKLENHYGNYQKGVGQITSKISHKFNHIRLMKAFKGELNEEKTMTSSFDDLTKNFRQIISLSAIQNALVNSLMMGFIIIMLVVAGISVSKGTMTISTLTTFVLYMMQLIDPVTDISDAMTDISEFRSVSHRLLEVFDLDKEDSTLSTLKLNETDISLKNVTFAYDTDSDKTLNNISVDIPSGGHIAIVGPSGAGKSTIFSLLMQFYKEYDGEITVGKHNLRDFTPKQIRDLIGYIPQDNTLFHGTIRENLTYGKNCKISDDTIYKVLNQLELMPVVNSLEKGLETVITDSGVGLSEGQKQRFNIARAMMLEHQIYLMDEITASLDSVTERIITKAINRMTDGKTRLTIAHRLHTIKNADYILVLNKDGEVSDFGKHSQLTARNHLYNTFLNELKQVS